MASAENTPLHPADIFLNLIVTYLTPMFLADAGGNLTFARLAAMQAVVAYQARGMVDFLPIAQVISFGLATLDSINRSMDDALPLTLVLRLRASATHTGRCAEACRKTLREPDFHADDATLAARAGSEYERKTKDARELAALASAERRLARLPLATELATTPPPAPIAPEPKAEPKAEPESRPEPAAELAPAGSAAPQAACPIAPAPTPNPAREPATITQARPHHYQPAAHPSPFAHSAGNTQRPTRPPIRPPIGRT